MVDHTQDDARVAGSAALPVPWPKALLFVLAAALLLSFWTALRYPLLDPDEGRNAEVAREMAKSGDIVIPHLAGVPYLDKPPGLFATGGAGGTCAGSRAIGRTAPGDIGELRHVVAARSSHAQKRGR